MRLMAAVTEFVSYQLEKPTFNESTQTSSPGNSLLYADIAIGAAILNATGVI